MTCLPTPVTPRRTSAKVTGLLALPLDAIMRVPTSLTRRSMAGNTVIVHQAITFLEKVARSVIQSGKGSLSSGCLLTENVALLGEAPEAFPANSMGCCHGMYVAPFATFCVSPSN